MIPGTIEAEVVIIAPHEARAWQAELPNGKRVIAFLEKGAPDIDLAQGCRVRTRLSLADFSRACIVTAGTVAGA